MNNEKRLIRNAISYKESEFRKITIAETKVALEIIRLASQSQEIEDLMKGLDYCYFIRQAMEEVGIIRYDEIDSSEEEIKSLENEIDRRLLVSGKIVVMGETRETSLDSFLSCLVLEVIAAGLDY